MCGICLLEEGKAVRGQIDCCNRYFCYVCIMEWAKKESLCPICKQRFRSIRRPPKGGVFARVRIFEVPARDQGELARWVGGGEHGPTELSHTIIRHPSSLWKTIFLLEIMKFPGQPSVPAIYTTCKPF
ncbi:hypothetical protein MRB53_006568 [Persea americana]|uniref:Uncharacterized protein n=1 Tax=Persea americana TaxID=3435 RepID=A0ACC2MGN9_PERAE|nr:hypothetical protein MRB53_006568 [Persea americana]